MPDFPTLSTQPDVAGWAEERAFDPTIRVRSDAGYLKTRARTTRVPMQWKLVYADLPAADKAALQSFENTVKIGADAFIWTNPDTGAVVPVRFREPVKYSPVSTKNYWRAEFTLEEV